MNGSTLMLERLQLFASMCPWAVQLNVKGEKADDDYGWITNDGWITNSGLLRRTGQTSYQADL